SSWPTSTAMVCWISSRPTRRVCFCSNRFQRPDKSAVDDFQDALPVSLAFPLELGDPPGQVGVHLGSVHGGHLRNRWLFPFLGRDGPFPFGTIGRIRGRLSGLPVGTLSRSTARTRFGLR